jgi:hypothetical protein
MGGVVDENCSRLGGRLETRGDVDGVAEGGVLDPRACADLAHDHGPRRRADPHAEALGAPAAAHLARILVHLADDAERAADGPLGVVLPRSRRAEEGEDSVACEVLDVAAQRLHLADDPRDRLADDQLHVLGVEPVRERGRADDVGKDCRQDLPLLPDCGGHGQRKANERFWIKPGAA